VGWSQLFLFAGAGSVTRTLWPMEDEHGAVFSCRVFEELIRAREERGKGEGKEKEVGKRS
jgi:hypothetical protein